MNKKILSYLLTAVFVVAAVGAVKTSEYSDNFKKIKYSVEEIDGTWKVVDERKRPRPIEAKAKDDVEWKAEGSDLIFQFPAELGPFLQVKEGEYDGDNFVARVKDGKKLRLRLKNNAPVGEFTYSVYVKVADDYAEGSSPPVIIIRN